MKLFNSFQELIKKQFVSFNVTEQENAPCKERFALQQILSHFISLVIIRPTDIGRLNTRIPEETNRVVLI